MTDKPQPLLALAGVTKRFRKFAAVSDVSFEVQPGEVVGFVGENGAGKTTTINMLLGFTSPSSGDVALFGEPVTPAGAHRSHRQLGYAAGDMELPDHLTGRGYIKFVLAQSGSKHTERYEQLVAAFRPQLDKKIGSLSRGNKQKIALVAALVTEPKLVIFDEPTSGLDPVMQDVFLDTVRQEAARGTTVFMSSHYLGEVAEVCTRMLLMKQGEIVEDLSATDLARRGGKLVTLTSTHGIVPPETARRVDTRAQDGKHTVSFGYTGDMAALTKWLGAQRGVVDLDVTERTLEDEFKYIYNAETKDEVSDE